MRKRRLGPLLFVASGATNLCGSTRNRREIGLPFKFHSVFVCDANMQLHIYFRIT